jgi:peroxiredoxin
MKKVGIIILLGAATIWLPLLQGKSFSKKESPGVTQDVNEYPNMKLILSDGSIRSARNLPAKCILVIYFPDCDHCQREATAISNHLTAFKNYHLWFITTASYTDIQRFSVQYKLMNHSNVHFVRTETQDVLSNFGGIPTPSVFIYSAEKKLVKAFKGETKVKEILKQL